MDDYDARLVELYDDDNPDGSDHGFYRQVADEIDARTILDIGCGTGMLTASFARAGRTVVGIDPSPNMLAFATNRANGQSVRWILGDSRDIPAEPFDYAVMTGNVAQHIVDSVWDRTLTDIREALRDGGVLAFESRNPQARAWEKWAAAEPTLRDTANGPLREWCEVNATEPGQIVLAAHNRLEDTGERITELLTLAFRERKLIEQQPREAGFVVDGVWSDWNRLPYTDSSPIMVFETHRAGSTAAA